MRIRALVIRILRQFIHDKRTIALMIVAPILILTLTSLVFNGSEYTSKLGVVDVPQQFLEKLEKQNTIINKYTLEEAEKALADNKIDAIIYFSNKVPQVKLEGSDPQTSKSVLMLMQNVSQDISPTTANLKPVITYLHGSPDMASFDNFGPVLIGVFVFFFVFLIAGVAFLRERTSGTLERLLATPLRRHEIVFGYIIGFGIFTMVQSALISWFAIKVLGIMMEGSFWLVLLITLLTAMTALTMGTFLSAFANNEFQMIQFIPIVIVPQIFFSGLFNMETMVEWLRWIGYFMPLYYVADALRNIMIRGNGWSFIEKDVYILLCLSIFFMVANVLALRKHRKI